MTIEAEHRNPGETGVEGVIPARVRITVRQVNRQGKVLPGGASWQVTLGGVKLDRLVYAVKTFLTKEGWT